MCWKLIIVDDCSTDGSWDILTDYAQKDARITIHRLVKIPVPEKDIP